MTTSWRLGGKDHLKLRDIHCLTTSVPDRPLRDILDARCQLGCTSGKCFAFVSNGG